MVSAFTVNKKIEQPAFNDYVNSWDVPVNADWAIIDKAFGGVGTVNLTGLSGSQVLTQAQYQPLKIAVSGGPTANTNLVVPSGVGGLWVVRNDTTGGFAITISSAAGGSLISVPVGTNTLVTCDGTAVGMFLAINTAPVAGGTNTQVQFNNSGVLGGSAGMVWNGTTLTTTGLTNNGNTILGDAAGDTLTIGGATASTPNGFNFNSNQLVLATPPALQVGIGTATLGSDTLTVAGSIRTTAGGLYFPDGTLQTTAFTATGMVASFVGSALPPGWVWANGTTIGNAASNATGRANATDTLALFTALWGWNNAQAAIFTSTGVASTRGANALADFNANKAIAVPDLRGTVVAGMDVIGGSTYAGRLSNMASTTPGAVGGIQAASTSPGVSGSSLYVADAYIYVQNQGLGTAQINSAMYSMDTESSDIGGLQGGGGYSAAQSHIHNNTLSAAYGVYGQMRSQALGGSAGYVTVSYSLVQPTMVMNKIIKL